MGGRWEQGPGRALAGQAGSAGLELRRREDREDEPGACGCVQGPGSRRPPLEQRRAYLASRRARCELLSQPRLGGVHARPQAPAPALGAHVGAQFSSRRSASTARAQHPRAVRSCALRSFGILGTKPTTCGHTVRTGTASQSSFRTVVWFGIVANLGVRSPGWSGRTVPSARPHRRDRNALQLPQMPVACWGDAASR